MSAADLLSDLDRLHIRLDADGERLRFFPQSAMTPELLDRLRTHKAELLALLRPEAELPGIWRERIVNRRNGPVMVLERIDPPQRFPWLSDLDFEDLPEPWR